MTRKITSNPTKNVWLLQDAKARFSEVVRQARSKGPQHITLHGREAVVVVASDEFARIKGAQNGLALIEALQSSPFSELELTHPKDRMPVREVKL